MFTAVALSLYFYYTPFALDYIFTPIAIAFIIFSAYRRDGWAGVAGAAVGVLLIPVLDWTGILADVSQFFWSVLTYLVASLWQFIGVWALYIFTAGLFAGIMPFVSIVLGVLSGLITGFAISGVSLYITYVTNSAKRFIHKVTHRLPPGAMALTALPTASLVMAVEVAIVLVILIFAATFATGFIVGSLLGSTIFPIKIVGDGVSYLIGLVISQFWHRIELDAFSPAAWFATLIAYYTKVGTPAMLMAIATATLLSTRRGHSAYTWMAVALSVHAYLAWVGTV
ncbi:MAG: hypothetical protein ACO2PN_14655 [Pyrobaculum sp.]